MPDQIEYIDFIFSRLLKLCELNEKELPVSALLISEKDFIERDLKNSIESTNIDSLHAEMIVTENKETLKDSIIFVTLEPCPQCLWNLVRKEVKYIIFGASNDIYKTNGLKILDELNVTRKPKFFRGFEATRISEMLKKFFQARR